MWLVITDSPRIPLRLLRRYVDIFLVHHSLLIVVFFFFFSSRRRHTRCGCDWSSDVCSSDLAGLLGLLGLILAILLKGGWRAFAHFGVWHFITSRVWNPVSGRQDFGALPFIYGTVVTSAVAVVLDRKSVV